MNFQTTCLPYKLQNYQSQQSQEQVLRINLFLSTYISHQSVSLDRLNYRNFEADCPQGSWHGFEDGSLGMRSCYLSFERRSLLGAPAMTKGEIGTNRSKVRTHCCNRKAVLSTVIGLFSKPTRRLRAQLQSPWILLFGGGKPNCLRPVVICVPFSPSHVCPRTLPHHRFIRLLKTRLLRTRLGDYQLRTWLLRELNPETGKPGRSRLQKAGVLVFHASWYPAMGSTPLL